MELATALIWTLRIVLPIILFCIYFKLQSPKEEQYSGSAKYKYTREKLVAHRKAVLTAPVPQELDNIALKDQAQAPALFAHASGRASRGGAGQRREDRPARERGDREPRRERPEGDRPRRNRERPPQEQDEEQEEVVVGAPADDAGALDAPLLSTSEEKMHIESLLNYVAFNRSAQQRTFLPDEDVPPPPPPPKRPTPSTAPAVSPEASGKANLEAQMVLKGAINFKRADVARNLYDKLLESQVEISELTFKLMIDACVLARDLKAASDFVMKMETYGYNPDSDVLDRVMDLYSQQKSVKEQGKQAPAENEGESTFSYFLGPRPAMDAIVPAKVEELLDGPRAKLKSDAPIFVPSFGIPPPPPKTPHGEAQSEPQPPPPPEPAEVQAPEGQGENAVETPPVQRTKLTTSAKPFEPSFGAPLPFDANQFFSEYGWAEEHQIQDWNAEENITNGRWGNRGARAKGGRKEQAEWWPEGENQNGDEWWPEGENADWWPADESRPQRSDGAQAGKGSPKAKAKYKAKMQPKEQAAEKEASKEKKQPAAKVWKPKDS